MEGKYSTILTVALVVVILVILVLLGFWGFSEYQKVTMIKEQEVATEVFENNTKKNNSVVEEETELVGDVVNPYDSIQTIASTTNSTTPQKQLYKGFVMVGRIEIPKTSLNLPVLEEVTKKSIETSVAILYGPGLNKPGNTVIVGHNYRNGTLFSNNAKIATGDKIYITDLTGKKVTYVVYNTYITTPEDSEYMTREVKQGDMEISLSTCTDDSTGRIIICAKAEQN